MIATEMLSTQLVCLSVKIHDFFQIQLVRIQLKNPVLARVSLKTVPQNSGRGEASALKQTKSIHRTKSSANNKNDGRVHFL